MATTIPTDSAKHDVVADDKIEDVREKTSSSDAEKEVAVLDAEYDEQEAKRVLKKVDFRLVPLLSLLYLISFIDRSNIGNARIAGLEDDLKMNKNSLQYNTAVTLFFVPYTLLEIPSNIVLKLMKPSRWIAILMFSWGIVMTLMCLIGNYSGLLAARWFLGVTESGFFPAATFLLTLWYRRYEVQRRMAVFYVAASLSGAFSGLLAYAIMQLDGDAGLSGWQWIFLIEGLVPVSLSLVIWKLLPDGPDTASFLTQKERDFLVRRLAEETGSGRGQVTNDDKMGMKHIKSGLSDWKVWAAVVVFWGNTVGVYGFTATVPTVINGLGYTAETAQLLTIPIYVFASILTIIFAWGSDYKRQRSPFIIGGFSIAAVGFIAQLAIPHPKYPGLTYGFLFPVAGGLYCPFICLVSWIGNSLAPSSKRAVGMALLISVGNMGGIMGSNIYLSREKPKYTTGFAVSLAMCLAAIAMTFLLRWAYGKENARREALISEHGEEVIRARYTDQEMLDLGDRSPFFRYTL
ncbi:major facilitator superfamily domain-containing protein [Massariosphaeria phaeospora]|uniref:Major facilitator superfamily domain-containing protein n=1 Tax=Massariosphaeria phaeospora TaxID=100035 RepID=A0A7C8IAE7_9PLEO|nr:major facilitator superfamily domain-containing protein [Massariosphaeria phaeospora]